VAPRVVVDNDESAFVWLRSEVADKRQALLETQAQLAAAQAATERETAALERAKELTEALLITRDVVRGFEAAAGTARRRGDRLQGELDQARAVIDGMRGSWTWRAGRLVTAPVRLVRRMLSRFR
jgi:acyl-CoA reductase-like NAD-dependent aldehyde dehydrogenase